MSSQVAYRVRSDDSQLVNADTGWAAAENSPVSIPAEEIFGLRIEIEQSSLVTSSYKLQYRDRPSGGSFGAWTDVPSETGPGEGDSATSRVTLYPSVGLVEGAATADVLTSSGLTFIPGSGHEGGSSSSTNSTSSVTLDNEHTEFEWRLRFHKFFDGPTELEIGREFEFRVVQSDNTLLGSYVEIAFITIAAGSGVIGGTYSESPTRTGPFANPNGDLYCGLEYALTTNQFLLVKSDDGGATWTQAQVTGRTTLNDIESLDGVLVGDVLHMAEQGTGTDTVNYFTFHTSSHPTTPDTWQIEEQVDPSLNPQHQQATIAVRSDGSVFVGYATKDGANDHQAFKIRSSGGTWGSETIINEGDGNVYNQIICVKEAGTDVIWIFYWQTTGTVFYRTLPVTNVLSGENTLTTDVTAANSDRHPVIVPLAYQDSGNEIIAVPFKAADDTIKLIQFTNGTPATVEQVSDQAIANHFGASGRPVAGAALDGTTIHVIYADSATNDIWQTERPHGGSWTTDLEIFDNQNAHWISALPVSTGIGIFYDNGSDGGTGYGRYAEHVLASVPSVQPNSLEVETNISQPAITQTLLGSAFITWLEVVIPASLATTVIPNDIEVNVDISQPTISQQHIVAPNSLIVDVEVSQPSLSQTHFVAPSSLDVFVEISQPIISVTGSAQPNSLEVNVDISQPTISQQHIVAPNDIDVDVDISQPTLVQTHVVTPDDIDVDVDISQPSLTQQHIITVDSLEVSIDISQLVLTQQHFITPNSLLADVDISQPALTQQHIVTVDSLSVDVDISQPGLLVTAFASPQNLDIDVDVSQPAISQQHFITPNSLSVDSEISQPQVSVTGTAQPQNIDVFVEISQPALIQQHFLTPNNLDVDVEISQPGLLVIGSAQPDSLEVTVDISQPALTQQHIITVDSLEVTVDISQPIVSVTGSAQPNNLDVFVDISQPTLIQTHILSPDSLDVFIDVSQPAISQQHIVTPNSLEVETNISQPVAFVTGTAQPNSLDVFVEISQPSLIQQHFLTPNSLLTDVEISQPTLTPVVSTQPNSINVDSEISQPALIQTHVLAPNNLEVSIDFSQPIVSVTGIAQPLSLSVVVEISQPTLIQQHFLTVDNLDVFVDISQPNTIEVQSVSPNSLIADTEISQPSVTVQNIPIFPQSLSVDVLISTVTLFQQHFITPNNVDVDIDISQPTVSPSIKGVPHGRNIIKVRPKDDTNTVSVRAKRVVTVKQGY